MKYLKILILYLPQDSLFRISIKHCIIKYETCYGMNVTGLKFRVICYFADTCLFVSRRNPLTMFIDRKIQGS